MKKSFNSNISRIRVTDSSFGFVFSIASFISFYVREVFYEANGETISKIELPTGLRLENEQGKNITQAAAKGWVMRAKELNIIGTDTQDNIDVDLLPNIYTQRATSSNTTIGNNTKVGEIEVVLELHGIKFIVPIWIMKPNNVMRNGKHRGIYPQMVATPYKNKEGETVWYEQITFRAFDDGNNLNGAVKMAALYNWMKEFKSEEHFMTFGNYCRTCRFIEYHDRSNEAFDIAPRYWCKKHQYYVDEEFINLIDDTISFTTHQDLKGPYMRQSGYQAMTTNDQFEVVTDGRNSTIVKRITRKQNLNDVAKLWEWETCEDSAPRYGGFDVTPIRKLIEKVPVGDELDDTISLIAATVLTDINPTLKTNILKDLVSRLQLEYNRATARGSFYVLKDDILKSDKNTENINPILDVPVSEEDVKRVVINHR